jgi:hypothetical protein
MFISERIVKASPCYFLLCKSVCGRVFVVDDDDESRYLSLESSRLNV